MTTTISRRAVSLVGFFAMVLAVLVPQQFAFAEENDEALQALEQDVQEAQAAVDTAQGEVETRTADEADAYEEFAQYTAGGSDNCPQGGSDAEDCQAAKDAWQAAKDDLEAAESALEDAVSELEAAQAALAAYLADSGAGDVDGENGDEAESAIFGNNRIKVCKYSGEPEEAQLAPGKQPREVNANSAPSYSEEGDVYVGDRWQDEHGSQLWSVVVAPDATDCHGEAPTPTFDASVACVEDEGEIVVSIAGAVEGASYTVTLDAEAIGEALVADEDGDGAVTITELDDGAYDIAVLDGEDELFADELTVDCAEESGNGDDNGNGNGNDNGNGNGNGSGNGNGGTTVLPDVIELSFDAEAVCVLPGQDEQIHATFTDVEGVDEAKVILHDAATGEALHDGVTITLEDGVDETVEMGWPSDGDALLDSVMVEAIAEDVDGSPFQVTVSLDDLGEDCLDVAGEVEEKEEVDEETETDVETETEEREAPTEQAREVAQAELPKTGASALMLALFGLTGVASGGALLGGTRRRGHGVS